MSDSPHGLKWLGPLALPITITISLIALGITFQSYATTIGWKVISVIFAIVTVVWSFWYLRVTKMEPSQLHEGETRKVLLHTDKRWRRGAIMLPIVAVILCGAAWFQPKEEDYSALFEGGGPYSPIIVFDSNPRGAEVRIARAYYGDNDPQLKNKSNDNITILSEHTLTRASLFQGHYWVVFELNGQTKSRYLVVYKPQVLKVDFEK